jgi:predicted enzyme related to lactoylglutathione lyase
MANPVVHCEFWTKSPKKVAEFYQKVFDWKIQSMPEMNYHMVEPGCEGSIGGGIMTPQDGTLPGNTSFYIDVDDLVAYRKRIQDAGGKILVEKQEVPGMGAYSFFSDPDGRVIGIWRRAAS